MENRAFSYSDCRLPTADCRTADCLLLSALCLGLLTQHFEEGRGGMREGNVAAVCDPQCSEVAQLRHGDGCECTALQFFGNAHPWNKREAYLKVNEAFDSFYYSQL